MIVVVRYYDDCGTFAFDAAYDVETINQLIDEIDKRCALEGFIYLYEIYIPREQDFRR